MVLLQCTNSVADAAITDWSNIIASAGAVLVGIVAIFVGYLQSERSYREKKLEEKRALISKKLDDFYGPLIQLREKSNKLYEKFRKKYYDKDPNFATLTYILDGFEFEENDKILLKEIIDIGGKCETLIHEKAGLIDDKELRDVLMPRATTHFLLMRLAFSKALSGRSGEFRDLTFPRDLDKKLKERKEALEKEMQALLQ